MVVFNVAYGGLLALSPRQEETQQRLRSLTSSVPDKARLVSSPLRTRKRRMTAPMRMRLRFMKGVRRSHSLQGPGIWVSTSTTLRPRTRTRLIWGQFDQADDLDEPLAISLQCCPGVERGSGSQNLYGIGGSHPPPARRLPLGSSGLQDRFAGGGWLGCGWNKRKWADTVGAQRRLCRVSFGCRTKTRLPLCVQAGGTMLGLN
jgi:hypothetical protein